MKKIVSSLALASILVSGLYAQQGGANCDFRKDGKNSPINPDFVAGSPKAF